MSGFFSALKNTFGIGQGSNNNEQQSSTTTRSGRVSRKPETTNIGPEYNTKQNEAASTSSSSARTTANVSKANGAAPKPNTTGAGTAGAAGAGVSKQSQKQNQKQKQQGRQRPPKTKREDTASSASAPASASASAPTTNAVAAKKQRNYDRDEVAALLRKAPEDQTSLAVLKEKERNERKRLAHEKPSMDPRPRSQLSKKKELTKKGDVKQQPMGRTGRQQAGPQQRGPKKRAEGEKLRA